MTLYLQYLFVLLRGEDFYVGGHVWRNDQYGSEDWVDVTDQLKGEHHHVYAIMLCSWYHARLILSSRLSTFELDIDQLCHMELWLLQ